MSATTASISRPPLRRSSASWSRAPPREMRVLRKPSRPKRRTTPAPTPGPAPISSRWRGSTGSGISRLRLGLRPADSPGPPCLGADHRRDARHGPGEPSSPHHGDRGRDGNHRHPVTTAHLGRADRAVHEEAAGSGRARPQVKLVVNGAGVEVDDRHAKTPLLWVLRDVLGLHGTKCGCGAGFCAACTVLIDGRNMKACQTTAAQALGKQVTTVEGASGAVVDAIRDAWHRANVVQCGYCQPGQTLAAVALLESDPAPDDAAIDAWMSGNLCRCGTYPRIRAAIHAAAATLAADGDVGALAAPPALEDRRLTAEELVDPVHPYIRIHSDGTVV